MNTNELTLERALPVWWAFTWRATLSAGVAGLFVGFVGGWLVAVVGSPELARPVGAVLGWVAAIPCSIWSFREALSGSYQDFDLVLVAKAAPPARQAASEVPPVDVPPARPVVATPKLPVEVAGVSHATPRTPSVALFVGLLGLLAVLVLAGSLASNVSTPADSTPPEAAAPQASSIPSQLGGAVEPLAQPSSQTAAPTSKGANMLICDPLPRASDVTPSQVDMAGRAADTSGMTKVQDDCLKRQAYLLAATGGAPGDVADAAIKTCSAVIDEYRAITRKTEPGVLFDWVPADHSVPTMQESVLRNVEQARVGKCWLQ